MEVIVNNASFHFNHVKDALSYMWSVPLQHEKYSSLETLKENAIVMCDLVIELCSLEKDRLKKNTQARSEKSFLTRTQTKMGEMKKNLAKKKTNEEVSQLIYELILSSENKSTLPGFGFCSKSHGDKLKGNPERDSILREQ